MNKRMKMENSTEEKKEKFLNHTTKSSEKISLKMAFVKLRDNEHFRDKWIYTLCILSASWLLGWVKALFGPSFLDLIMISDVSLIDGSWIVTTFYIGYVIGSVVGGMVYKAVDPHILFVVAGGLMGLVHCVIPWSSIFGLMLFNHFLKGVGAGVIDVVAAAEMFRIWQVKGSKFYVFLCLAYSIGCVISPLVAAPFLTESKSGPENQLGAIVFNTSLNSSSVHNEFYNLTYPVVISANTPNSSSIATEKQSDVYVAYFLTAFICFIDALLFLILFLKHRRNKKDKCCEKKAMSDTVRELPMSVRLIAFGLLGASLMLFSAIDEGFVSYLSAFCVEYFSWSKRDGAFATSLVFIFVMISRILFAIILGFINIVVLYITISLILFLDLLGFLLISLYFIDIAVWISISIFGFFKAIMFAVILSWINQYFFPVTGVVASYAMVVAMIGNAVTPLLIGFLMDKVGDIAFAYVFLAETGLLFVIACVGSVFTKYVLGKYGVTYNNTQHIDVHEAKMLTASTYSLTKVK